MPERDAEVPAPGVSAFRFHEISEATHRICNPLSPDKLLLLGEICRAHPATRVLDLACGKGELLCQLAERHGATGVGIDLHPPFLADARSRARELMVESSLTFLEGDAGSPTGIEGPFDIVCCLGATWIAGGLAGTLRLMGRWLAPAGWMLVGEPYWASPPSEATRRSLEVGQRFGDLAGTLAVIEAAGFDLVEMVLASLEDWDRYAASQWLNVADWLAANPTDADAPAVREQRDASRRAYLDEERDCLGWGVFVLRASIGS
jgi:SAM-dependent methyltransferase